jgi:hypothetical protein
VEGNPADSLGDQREDRVSAVAVGEPFAGRELGRVPPEHRQVLLSCRKILRWRREHVVGELVVGVLIEVVTDARPVRQQVLDRHVLAYERQVCAQHRARGGGQAQHAIADQADHRGRGQPLRSAGDREPGVDGIRYPARAVSQAIRLGELDHTATVDRDHASESALLGKRVDRLRQGHHPRTLPPDRGRGETSIPIGGAAPRSPRGTPALKSSIRTWASSSRMRRSSASVQLDGEQGCDGGASE